jgi:hypothetical protein
VTQFTVLNRVRPSVAAKSLKYKEGLWRWLAHGAQAVIMVRMDRGDGDKNPDDGIVAEDLTMLVEHIELTSQHR